ncbi:hypothetical protein BCR32DRAFT_330741 [Anaeromyces robustus]|uniref:Uncharacterized protein n=1 Tax=Anaeromyces robustus TaxID=1754192 RepID=A0A1Y1VRQ5_9FUNG|nr:hypothetical protein BCR32DRAFT_330741 [Anaeromyces robustus]|eukprot:ORX63960.1 hypothetical protein BCR32DRAFT_330741 [Anaeromyces robustus]
MIFIKIILILLLFIDCIFGYDGDDNSSYDVLYTSSYDGFDTSSYDGFEPMIIIIIYIGICIGVIIYFCYIDILPSAPPIYSSREIPMNTDNTNFGIALTETNENTNSNTTFINNTNTVQLQNPNNGNNIDVNSLFVHLEYLRNYIIMNIPNQNQAPPSYMNINGNTNSNTNNNEQQQQQQQQSFTTTTINTNEDNNVCSILPSYSQLLRQHFARNSPNIPSNNDNDNQELNLDEKHIE